MAEPSPLPQPRPTQEASAGPTSLNLARTTLTFYGFLRLDTILSDSQLNHPQYSMWAASEAEGAENDGLIDMHPRLTRFGLKLHREGLSRIPSAKLDGNLEIDFQNRASGEPAGGTESRQMLRLRHGYLKLTVGAFSVLAGQSWDLIAPLWPIVNADGMMWNSGNLGDRRPQIRLGYEPKLFGSTKLQVEVAIARTGAVDLKDLDANNVRDGDDSGLPMVQGRLGLASLFDAVDIGVWGHWAREETKNVPNQPDPDPADGMPPPAVVSGRKEFTSSSVGGDVSVKVGKLTVAGEAWVGKNLSDVRGGIGQGVGKVSGEEIGARGGWGNVRVAVVPWLAVGAGATFDDALGGQLVAGDRTQNLAAFGNLELDAGGGFIMGLDYIHWRTEYVDRPRGDANRFDLYGMYRF